MTVRRFSRALWRVRRLGPRLALGAVLIALGTGTGVGAGTPGGPSNGVPGPVPARLVVVIDGDTIEVKARIWIDQAVTTRVRLLGVDAPELNGTCAAERRLGRRARDAVADLIGAGAVTLTDIRYGKYAGRVLAHVATAAGVDVATALVARGLARAYDGGTRPGWCP